MSDEQTPPTDKSESGLKAVVILIVISPIFIVVIGLIFVAQLNNLKQDPAPKAAQTTASAGGASAVAAAPAAPPSAYASCVSCHGAEGEGIKNDVFAAPRLAGQSAWYLKKQLMKFKDGKRGAHPEDKMGAQMVPFAKLLPDDAAVDAVIAEILEMKPATPVDTGTGDAARGAGNAMICKTCHGQSMEGNEAQGGPALSGQHAWYLYNSLQSFKAGIRGGSEDDMQAQQMRAMCMMLATEDQMNDVIAAIQAIK